jgi:small GTP-binding protein
MCLLGAYGVGKTSLVSRFVHSMFSEKYMTTIGVKIDKKTVDLGHERVDLILWDIHGEDEYQKVRMSYIRGASGYLLVVDGTRRSTLDTALSLHESAQRTIGHVPFMVAVNKADLATRWEFDTDLVGQLGLPFVKTSAKSGAQVEEAFESLSRAMLLV